MSAQHPSGPAASAPRVITLHEVARFFLPLIFMAELMMITHSIIHAWLARGSLPTISLAGFAIAFSLNALLSSIFRSMHPIALSFISDRRSIRRVWGFGMSLVVLSMGTIALVAHTPLGDWIYGGLLGASPAVTREARSASAILLLIYPLQCTRNVGAGLLMVQRRTLLLSYGTALRVLALGALLLGLGGVVGGARLGAVALVGCVGIEALFVTVLARPFYRRLPAASGRAVPYGEMWRFSWPIIANAMLENSLNVLINVFVGRLDNADVALAAFGVTRGLLMLMMAPLRNLAQTAQAMTRTREDLRVMLRFAWITVAAYVGVIGVLFYTPLRDVILGRVMGLAPGLQAAIDPAVLLFAVTPPLWAMASTYRGLLSGARRTGVLAFSGGVRLAAVLAVSSVCLLWPQANGAMVGVLALAGAFGCEAALLGRSLNGYLHRGQAFPTRTAQGATLTPADAR